MKLFKCPDCGSFRRHIEHSEDTVQIKKGESFTPFSHEETFRTLHGIIELHVRAEKEGLPEHCTKALTDMFTGTVTALGMVFVSHSSEHA
jgi:hypothetical protein